MNLKTKFDIGQKVYAIFKTDEFYPEQIEITGIQVSINFDNKNSGTDIIYMDKTQRYINERRCYVTKDDLVEHFKKSIKDL